MMIEQIWPVEPTAELAVERETLSMDQRSFEAFYHRTAPKLHGYLTKLSGSPSLADDLVQESYFRLLRSGFEPEDETHRKNYLFRIGANLLRDHFRKHKHAHTELPVSLPAGERLAQTTGLRRDLGRQLETLNLRERELLWLAYVEGFDHKEIAEITGLKAASIRPLLFRARQRMAEQLRRAGLTPKPPGPKEKP